ncbi:LVIVD repeat-containing protein [Acidobacteriota bacterium]
MCARYHVWLCAVFIIAQFSTLHAWDGDSQGFQLTVRSYEGQPNDVVVWGAVAYAGLDTGIEAIDIQNPDDPQSLDHIYLPSPAYKLSLSGNYLYVACGESGLQIVDIRDPSNLILAGSMVTEGTRGVFASGSTVYLAEAGEPPNLTHGLRIVDASNPASPASLAFLPLVNGGLDVTLTGTNALVGLGSSMGGFHGLAVIDISNPLLPVQVGIGKTGRPVHDIEVTGSRAILATGFPLSGRVVVMDLSVPSNPTVQSYYPVREAAYSLCLDGTKLHVAAGALGWLVFDASDLSSLSLEGASIAGMEARAVAFEAGAIVLGQRGYNRNGAFSVGNIDLAGLPVQTATLPYTEATNVAAGGGAVYLVNRDGLHIFDASDPGLGTKLGMWQPVQANLSALGVDGVLAAISEGAAVHLVDVSDPSIPVLLSKAVLEQGMAIRPVLSGSVLFVVNGSGYEAFNISNPLSPIRLGTYFTTGYTSDLQVVGSTAYLTAGTDLQILDVSSPGTPNLIETYQTLADLYAVKVQNDIAMVSGYDNILTTIDVSTPSDPTFIAALTGGHGFDIALTANHALIAAGIEGVLAISVSDPAALAIDGFYDTSGVATNIAVSDTAVFLSTGMGQQWVLDCLFCSSPCQVTAQVLPPGPITVCQGNEVILDGSSSQTSGCAGELLFQWYEDGSLVNGATQQAYTIPASHQIGQFTIRLDVTCATDPSCSDSDGVTVDILTDSWPTVRSNSLRLSKVPDDHTFAWELESGAGEFNIHRTATRSDLPDLHNVPSTVVGTTDLLTIALSYDPPAGQVAYYRVYGRGSCTGLSYP